MWFVLHYNEEERNICVYQIEIDCAYDDALYLSQKYTNLDQNSGQVFMDMDEAIAAAEAINANLTSTIYDFLNDPNKLLLQKCTACGKYFIMNRKEGDWFASRNLKLPRRCVACRKTGKKKEEKKNA